MEDTQIVDLYWARSETAITETADKYGRYCYSIAYGVLHDDGDSEECVNDTWMSAWGAMPDQRPAKLSPFLGRITRNLSLKRWERNSAKKRGAGQVPLALDELSDCIPTDGDAERIADDITLTDALNRFLASLDSDKRKIFMRRYWYFSPVAEIAADFGVSESRVKMTLLRCRKELKKHLEKEGVEP